MKKIKGKSRTANNVFEDLGFPPEESRVLVLKAQLAALIIRTTHERKLTQRDLSKLWDVPQPRVSEVMTGKLSLVSIERLVEFLGILGVEVDVRMKQPRNKAG